MGPTMQPAQQRRLNWVAVLVILLLAAFLRLGQTGIVEFKRDEATLSRLALDFAQSGEIPLLGIGSSVGYPNAPINVYLLAIPYAVSDNPLIATLFIAFLNIIAVALLWRMTYRYFGASTAFIAGILYAASPWAVIYSRKIWAQDMLAPFVILTVFTGLLGFLEGKRWAQVLHLPLLALTVQIHFGAVSLIPVTGVMLVLAWRRVRWVFVVGTVVAGLVSLPYLYGLYDADLLSIAALRDSLASGNAEEAERTRELSSTALDHAWFSVAGTNLHSLAGPDAFQSYLDSVPDYTPLFELLPIILVVTLLGGSVLAWRRHDAKWGVWVAWVVVPVLTFVYTWAEPQPHYMIPMLPAAYIVIGAGLVAVVEAVARDRIVGRAVLVVGVMSFALVQTAVFRDLLGFLDVNHTDGGFGTPLHYQLDVRQHVLDADTARVIVVSEGTSPQFDEGPAVWDVLLDAVPQVDFLAPEHLWLESSQPAALLVTSAVSLENDWFTPISSQPDIATFPARADESAYHFWPQFAVELSVAWQPVRAAYANGVALEAWSLADEVLTLRWRVPAGQADTLPIIFAHGISPAGERIQQVDLPFLAESAWQAGDVVYFKAPFTQSGLSELRIGLYTLQDTTFSNIPLVDEQGRYVEQWFTISLD